MNPEPYGKSLVDSCYAWVRKLPWSFDRKQAHVKENQWSSNFSRPNRHAAYCLLLGQTGLRLWSGSGLLRLLDSYSVVCFLVYQADGLIVVDRNSYKGGNHIQAHVDPRVGWALINFIWSCCWFLLELYQRWKSYWLYHNSIKATLSEESMFFGVSQLSKMGSFNEIASGAPKRHAGVQKPRGVVKCQSEPQFNYVVMRRRS